MTRRVRQLRARANWTDEHAGVLRHGHDWFGAFIYGQPMEVPARDRDGWDESPVVLDRPQGCVADIGDEVLTDWIASKPFTRPWFWWRFVAPEPRQRLNGPPRYSLPEYAGVPHRYHFGLPSLAVAPPFGADEVYETEADYLERLDLLTDIEQLLKTSPPPGPASAAADSTV